MNGALKFSAPFYEFIISELMGNKKDLTGVLAQD